ncbi:MAG: putative cytokinetic ring protein SteA [Thermincolia bacterium]
MYFKGIARIDKRTKDLAKRLQPYEIAIIDHKDLDEVAAESLVKCRCKAVINASPSISGKYPNLGPIALARGGIFLLDNVGLEIMDKVAEGQEIEIRKSQVFINGELVAAGEVLTVEDIKNKMDETKKNIGIVLENFVQNTITYVQQEQGLILGGLETPQTRTLFKDRHTLIVVRGQDYKEDLLAIKSYIQEMRPVLIGVDGGADALREFGYKPDLIIGDMDSISDETLKCGAEIVVHAYSDGRAPGLARVEELGLPAVTFPAPGTSEDIAMLLAYEKGTELIVAVGTHSNMIDFLEKGRKGMASTFLVRTKVGSILVDAKGVNKLYNRKVKVRHLAEIIIAALIPIFLVMLIEPSTRQLLRLVYMQLKLILGI